MKKNYIVRGVEDKIGDQTIYTAYIIPEENHKKWCKVMAKMNKTQRKANKLIKKNSDNLKSHHKLGYYEDKVGDLWGDLMALCIVLGENVHTVEIEEHTLLSNQRYYEQEDW